jgi:alpha-tubulin suppressor-like RCC1 family protein
VADPGEVGEVSLELRTVPSGVTCIQVVATSATVVTDQLTVSPGGSTASLSLGQLPLGSVSIAATAYNVACASIAGVTPVWQADPLTVTLRPGVVSTLALIFRPVNAVTANANFVPNISQIIASGNTTMALMADGTVKQWGRQIGNGLANTSVPTTVSGLTAVSQVAQSGAHACALKTNGTLWCWGSNAWGELGPGIAPGTASTTPVQVTGFPTGTTPTQVATGSGFSCALLSNRDAYCWGVDSDGQLGNGTTSTLQNPNPTRVSQSAGIVDAVYAGGDHACTLVSGMLNCWGGGGYGQIGVGGTGDYISPAGVSVAGFVAVSLAGYASCGLRGDGAVYCWGDNTYGQVGDGTSGNNRPAPTPVSGLTDATAIATGGQSACARKKSGAIVCWGVGYSGGIGDGTELNRLVPTPVLDTLAAAATPPATATGVVAGTYYGCSPMSDLSIHCWGSNIAGQLGDGTVVARVMPVAVQF